MGFQVGANRWLIERSDLQCEVINITTFGSGACATKAAQLARQWDQIDEGSASANLPEADGLLHIVDSATQHIAIEPHGSFEIANAQHNMVDLLQPEGHHTLTL